jgi:hypothetical protein
MDSRVGNIRREQAVPPHAVRRTPRERRNGERREFEADLTGQQHRGERAAKHAPSKALHERPAELGDDHVDVTA